MLKVKPAIAAIAALHVTIGAGGADAVPFAAKTAPADDGRQTLIHPVRNDRQPVRRIVSSSRSAGEKCGVWRCTWPLSGGGCLVWEKTLCKIKTIDPFN